MNADQLNQLTKAQGIKIKNLRSSGASAEEVEREVQMLKDLQKQLKELSTDDGQKKLAVKTPKAFYCGNCG